MNIAILSSSIRNERDSHRVALFFTQFLKSYTDVSVELIDLLEYNFPLFEERLKFQKSPAADTLKFAEKIKAADGIILVAPEYNGGYPASLKNVIDLLTDEWIRKPIAISTVSSGNFAGMNAIISLQYTLWKMKAWTVPALFPVVKVSESYDISGMPFDKTNAEKRAKVFIGELLWCIEASKKMS